MAVRTKIEPLDRSIVLAVRSGEDPAERSKALAAYARQAIADAQEQNRQATGHIPPHETWVDGRKGAPLESVKPDGVIVTEFSLIDEVLEWIGDMLVKGSPVKTGRYSESHILFADGVEVDPGTALPEAEEYVYLNIQPYARKIERGLSPQAPDGVYEGVASMARSRFSNIASIKFSFRSYVDGGMMDYIPTGTERDRTRNGRGQFSATPSAHADARARERANRQPAIVVVR